jgi:hypothetical protein
MICRKESGSVEVQHECGLHLHSPAVRTSIELPSSDSVKRVFVKIGKPGAALKMSIYHFARFQYLKGNHR